MPFPRLTWIGFLVSTLGWGFILSYPLIISFLPDGGGAGQSHDPARFIPMIGQNAIITGMALALLGALEKALRLLARISANSAQAKSQSRSSQALPAAKPQPANGNTSQAATGQPMLMPKRAPNEVVTRGALNGRDYVLFRDGSVVVETMLGPRRFKSITEAQEFIGAN